MRASRWTRWRCPRRHLLAPLPAPALGGQQQRVAIAMAFANRPKVIVCDEPTTGLDVTTQARVLETVRDLCRPIASRRSMSATTSPSWPRLADRVAVMYGGRIVESGPASGSSPRRATATQRLLLAVPDIAGERTVVGIPGHAALPGSRPDGLLHPRCQFAREDCRATFLTDLGAGHQVRCYRRRGNARVAARGRRPCRSDWLGRRRRARHERSQRSLRRARDPVRHQPPGPSRRVRRAGGSRAAARRRSPAAWPGCTGLDRRDSPGRHALAESARQRPGHVRKDIQYVFQNPYASLNPRRTVGQTIARQLRLFFPNSGRTSVRASQGASSVSRCRAAPPAASDQLGGERQRVAIARALAAGEALGLRRGHLRARRLRPGGHHRAAGTLRAEMGLSLLFITHDLALIRTIADRVAVMSDGRIVEQGPLERIFTSPDADYAQAAGRHAEHRDRPRPRCRPLRLRRPTARLWLWSSRPATSSALGTMVLGRGQRGRSFRPRGDERLAWFDRGAHVAERDGDGAVALVGPDALGEVVKGAVSLPHASPPACSRAPPRSATGRRPGRPASGARDGVVERDRDIVARRDGALVADPEPDPALRRAARDRRGSAPGRPGPRPRRRAGSGARHALRPAATRRAPPSGARPARRR